MVGNHHVVCHEITVNHLVITGYLLVMAAEICNVITVKHLHKIYVVFHLEVCKSYHPVIFVTLLVIGSHHMVTGGNHLEICDVNLLVI